MQGFCKTLICECEELCLGNVELLGDGIALCSERVYCLGCRCGFCLCGVLDFRGGIQLLLGGVHLRYQRVLFLLQGLGGLMGIDALHSGDFLLLGFDLSTGFVVCELSQHTLSGSL